MKNKRIAVIGTGASGVQTIQESGRDAKQLTVYQRTPNYALPMNQKPIEETNFGPKAKNGGGFEEAFNTVYTTFAGFTYDSNGRNTWDDTPEEREKLYHKLLVENGGFQFWLANYDDLFKDREANLEVRPPTCHPSPWVHSLTLSHLLPLPPHLTHPPGLQILAQNRHQTHQRPQESRNPRPLRPTPRLRPQAPLPRAILLRDLQPPSRRPD